MISTKQKGASVIEFAIVAPVLFLIMFGIIQFGWLLNNFTMVVHAAGVGARFFATQGGSTTAYADTLHYVTDAAPRLTLSISTKVNGSGCTDSSTPTCGAALTAGQGGQATVTVNYTNIAPLFRLSIAGFPGWPTAFDYTVAERAAAIQGR